MSAQVFSLDAANIKIGYPLIASAEVGAGLWSHGSETIFPKANVEIGLSGVQIKTGLSFIGQASGHIPGMIRINVGYSKMWMEIGDIQKKDNLIGVQIGMQNHLYVAQLGYWYDRTIEKYIPELSLGFGF